MAPSERLQKILSAAGLASRRGSEELIASGRVSVNDAVVTKLGSRADPERDRIAVDGVRVRMRRRRLHVLFYKPRGMVSTLKDPEGRPSLARLFGPGAPRLFHAGRLDLNSEGLLLLTNDGELAQRVTHPRYGCKKTYHVKVRGVPDARALSRLRKGVLLDGHRTASAEVKIKKVTERSSNAWLEVTIREGRSRQVRRMMEVVGHPVSKLRRERIGPLSRRGLSRGEFRLLEDREVAALWRATEEASGG